LFKIRLRKPGCSWFIAGCSHLQRPQHWKSY